VGIDEPTARQHLGALFVTDFMLKVINTLTKKD
jgi:hypothetical protein